MNMRSLDLFFNNVRPSILKLGLPGPLASFNNQNNLIRLNDNISCVSSKWSQYPDPMLIKQKENYLSLLSEIERQKGTSDLRVNSANLMFTTGAVDALDIVLKCLIHEQDTVVNITVPTFIGFQHWLEIYGAKGVEIVLKGNNKNRICSKEICSSNSKLLLLCNPNNPLGSQIPIEDIIGVLSVFDGIVVIDEAYMDFSTLPSSIVLLNAYPNLIILRSCSKSLGLAGLRIGAILAHRKIIEVLLRVQPVYNMPSPVVASFDHSLKKKNTIKIVSQINLIKKLRCRLIDLLTKTNVVEKIYSSETNFISVVFKNPFMIKDYLNKNNIALYWFQAEGELIARITVSLENEHQILVSLLERL